MAGKISGVALTAVAAGALFAYTAIRGKSITASIQALVQGKSPASLPQANPVTSQEPTAAQNDAAMSAAQADLAAGRPVPGITVGIPPGVAAPKRGRPAAAGGSNEAVLKATAASFGWTGPEWTALYNVEMAEAGFSLTATNPSTKAYGMAQMYSGSGADLAANKAKYYQYGGDPDTAAGQSLAMCNYIRDTYGTPSAAWAHEQAHHWY